MGTPLNQALTPPWNDLRRNIAYTMQGSEVFRWVLTRTSLFGLAKDMLIKQVLVLSLSVIESLLHDALKGVMSRHAKFNTRTARLEEQGVISADLRAELNWAWSARVAVHLFLVESAEIGKYRITDSNRSARAMRDLIAALAAERQRNIPF